MMNEWCTPTLLSWFFLDVFATETQRQKGTLSVYLVLLRAFEP